MKALRFTPVTDGPSDGGMLIPILEWLLRTHCGDVGINVVHADFRRCRDVPRGLASRIAFALEAYPCDSLFVHRDAEKDVPESRRREIRSAIEGLGARVRVPHICVIPVRMTEAWLLIDQTAIRHASGNPNGTVKLSIPPLSSLEDKPDPKQLLHELLITASELSGRRRKSFNPRDKVQRVAQYLEDFSPLRQLSAFRDLEAEVLQLIANNGWNM
jgi:hypothetical protein